MMIIITIIVLNIMMIIIMSSLSSSLLSFLLFLLLWLHTGPAFYLKWVFFAVPGHPGADLCLHRQLVLPRWGLGAVCGSHCLNNHGHTIHLPLLPHHLSPAWTLDLHCKHAHLIPPVLQGLHRRRGFSEHHAMLHSSHSVPLCTCHVASNRVENNLAENNLVRSLRIA